MEQGPSWEAHSSSAFKIFNTLRPTEDSLHVQISRHLSPLWAKSSQFTAPSYWKSRVHFTLLMSFQRICRVARLSSRFLLILSSYDEQLLSPLSTSHAGRPNCSECPRFLFQNIRSYPPYPRPFPSSATRGFAMSCWQGPSHHGVTYSYLPLYLIANLVFMFHFTGKNALHKNLQWWRSWLRHCATSRKIAGVIGILIDITLPATLWPWGWLQF